MSPGDSEQLGTLRPTLTVANGTSNQAGTRTYEFQISDRTDFALLGNSFSTFTIVVNRGGIPEGSGGTTSFALDSDLQPTTRLYWRARMSQGPTISAWSAARNFKTKLVGYNRPGELYDPLIHGETVGTPVGSTTFVPGRGIRINDKNSYVRYQLQQTITNGEFSMEVEGLSPNGPGGKMKVFSMMDGTGHLLDSKYLANVQYRGIPGNPDNAISFKMVFGDSDLIAEPDFARRSAGIRMLNPARKYFWKGTWGSEFHLVVQDGGIGGATIYDFGTSPPGAGTYTPIPHYGYLGANDGSFGVEDGSWPGATYSNVWIADKPRPTSLGSALRPPQ